jgi:LmbE family N-acetylglucosaminyl deacetylase
MHSVTEQVEKLGTVVSIWAHPDDETYLAGGLMAAAADNGQRVVCVSATAGERGTSDPVAWPPERLGRTRRWEAAAAMAVLGVTDHRFLDYPDGGMAALDPAAPVERITALLTEVQPDTVLTFGPDGGTFHPDHQTISAWVGAAWDRAGRPGRLLHATMTAGHLLKWSERYERWQVFMTDERPVGVQDEDLALDVHVTGELLDRKIAALVAMHTQIAPSVELLGMDDFRDLNTHEYFVEAPVGTR